MIGAIALVGSLAAEAAHGRGVDQSRYPALDGQWVRNIGAQWDASRARGPTQQSPLTKEYQAIFEANSAELFTSGEIYNSQIKCLPGGRPRMMIAYEPMEVILTPTVIYIWVEQMGEFLPMAAPGRRSRSPPFAAPRSADGSMKRAKAATIR